MNRRDNGFTLVEIIVVLSIIAILGAVTMPIFGNLIERAKKSNAIIECRNAVTAAQTLYLDNIRNQGAVTIEAIKARANVHGMISGVQVVGGELTHLTYTKAPWVVTYCQNWKTCEYHNELYSASKENSGSETDPIVEPTDDPGVPGVTADYFYIANDLNYKVSTLGDLSTYDFGPYGSSVPYNSVFYWQGDYYYTRDGQYLTNDSDIQNFINNYTVKIKNSGFTTAGVWTASGDLKLENGRVYVFFPYARYQNDYADDNYWLEVSIDKKTEGI